MNGPGTVLVTAGVVLALGLPLVARKHARAEELPASPGGEAALALPPAGELASTADVQEVDQLWRALQALQGEAPILGRSELEARALALTTAFLELADHEEARFVDAARAALGDLGAARERLAEVSSRTANAPEETAAVEARRAAWSLWQEEQNAAADRLLDALRPTPRHELLAEKRLPWLLRVDYGVRSAGAEPEAR